jgi:hypothetical protein
MAAARVQRDDALHHAAATEENLMTSLTHTLNPLSRLVRCLHGACLRWQRNRRAARFGAQPSGAAACDILLDVNGRAADDRPLGCGWFDSSYELGRGLVMTEMAADSPALPLEGWLHLQLAGWQPTAPSPAA